MSKNLKILKYFDKRNLGSIPRIFLSSLIVVFFFSSAPQIIDFFNSESREFKNKSKAILAYTLNDKGIVSQMTGSGKVAWQNPAPGTLVQTGTICKVGLK